jgi:hypothetical protein
MHVSVNDEGQGLLIELQCSDIEDAKRTLARACASTCPSRQL